MAFSDRLDVEPTEVGFTRQGDPDSAANTSRPDRRVLSVSTLVGDRVRNRAGEDLGRVEEIMLDLASGNVAYVVVSFGGFLGIGDKLFAVPWKALELNEEQHEFILDVDKQALENAPGFDKDNWPDMADANWGSQVHTHYGQEQYWSREVSESGPGTEEPWFDTPKVRSVGSSEIVENVSPGRKTYNG